MELFRKVRLKMGRLILSKKVSRLKRKIYYSNFNKIKNIGIVWDASRTAEFSSLNRFHQRMQEIKIDVTIFGYFPGKNLPDQYTAIRYLTCIRKDEVNKLYHPVSAEANSFINNPFDVLIDINFEKHFPLVYVALLSMARFKVGLYDNESEEYPFDLMMDIKNPVDIDGYLTKVIHYLEMIKDKTIKKVD